jgi:hypothetical protein
LRTSADVSVRDDLANGPHLDVDNALELRAGHTKLPPSFAETTLNASENCFACLDWQLGYLSADALRHRPATFCCLNSVVRQSSSSQLVLGRVGRAIGSLSNFAVCLH